MVLPSAPAPTPASINTAAAAVKQQPAPAPKPTAVTAPVHHDTTISPPAIPKQIASPPAAPTAPVAKGRKSMGKEASQFLGFCVHSKAALEERLKHVHGSESGSTHPDVKSESGAPPAVKSRMIVGAWNLVRILLYSYCFKFFGFAVFSCESKFSEIW